MAGQNVTIAGVTFSDVPSIITPVSGGGTATFVDTSDADATASDILAPKTAYVNGVKVVGTGSGGGGGTVTISIQDALGLIAGPLGWKICNTATVTQNADEPWKYTLITPKNSMAFTYGANSPQTPGCSNVTYKKINVASRTYIHEFLFGDQDGSITI